MGCFADVLWPKVLLPTLPLEPIDDIAVSLEAIEFPEYIIFAFPIVFVLLCGVYCN